jgi:hypothetical protein
MYLTFFVKEYENSINFVKIKFNKKNKHMKKTFLLFGVIGLLMSCEKLKELASTSFGLDGDSIEVTVPASGTASTLSFSSTTETIDFEAEIKKNNAELATKYIKSVTINSIDLEITSPASTLPNNWKNLKSYDFSINSDVKADKIQIASANPYTATNETKINIPVNTTIDLKDYVKEKAKFTYSFTGALNTPTTDSLKVKIKANYQIKVGL